MTEHDTNTLWISGWMWGKYPEQATGYHLPQDETEAAQWLEGFRWGTTEACQFHRLWEWLDETLAGHNTTIQLIRLSFALAVLKVAAATKAAATRF